MSDFICPGCDKPVEEGQCFAMLNPDAKMHCECGPEAVWSYYAEPNDKDKTLALTGAEIETCLYALERIQSGRHVPESRGERMAEHFLARNPYLPQYLHNYLMGVPLDTMIEDGKPVPSKTTWPDYSPWGA